MLEEFHQNTLNHSYTSWSDKNTYLVQNYTKRKHNGNCSEI